MLLSSVKRLSSCTAQFSRHCVFSDETERRAFALVTKRGNENNSFQVELQPTTITFTARYYATAPGYSLERDSLSVLK